MDLFADHCRLCRAESPDPSWPGISEHLQEKILACTGVRISPDDGLPRRICRRCEVSLDQANTFRLQCRDADTWWRFNFTVVKVDPIAAVYVKGEVEDDVALETVVKEELSDSEYEEQAMDDGSSEEEKDSKVKKRKKAEPKSFQCSECPKKFSKKYIFDEHEARHKGLKNFECESCEKRFYSERCLRLHVDRQHSKDQKYACDKCDRKFCFQTQLKCHYAVHSDERQFGCDLCSKAFKSKSQLNAHLGWVHSSEEVKEEKRKASERICVCPYCGKVSTSVKTHKVHLRTHTGEQNYECEICSKRFSALSSHRKHMLVHSDERPYQCQHCQKAFRQRHHLTTHIRGTHTHERPFRCRFCERSFVTRGNMRLHEKTHGEPPLAMDDGGGGTEVSSYLTNMN